MSSALGRKHAPHLHLITAAPGAGKTTAIKAFASALPSGSFAGFYTEEMRVSGQREGFKAITFGGKEAVLAHISFAHGPRVGKYRVDIPAFDRVAVPQIDPGLRSCDLFVLDEIGKMECFSDYFVRCVHEILKERKSLVATVAIKGPGLIQEIKKVPGGRIHRLDRGNRDRLPFDILDCLLD